MWLPTLHKIHTDTCHTAHIHTQMHISHLANFQVLGASAGKNSLAVTVTAAPTQITVPWLPVQSQHPGQASSPRGKVTKSWRRAKRHRAGSNRFAQGNRQCNHKSTKSMWCVDTIWSGKSDMILMEQEIYFSIECDTSGWSKMLSMEKRKSWCVGRNREIGCEMLLIPIKSGSIGLTMR